MRQSLASAALFAGLMFAGFTPAAALAQAAPDPTSGGTTFRGFRIEADAGGDRFKSQGISDNRFGYGATVGFDGTYANKILVGAEGTYWNPRRYSQNCTNPTTTSLRCDQEGRELGAAVRAGYLITPALLVFGKGGYVNAVQTGAYSTTTGFYYINGVLVGPGYNSSRRIRTDGYQAGGGVEYSLFRNFYVDAQYVYSRYDDHTRRERVMGGVGVRF